MVYAKNGKMSFDDVLSFLDTRVGLLDAVVISGGEATLTNLVLFCQQVKKRGFKIKLDTNGTNPKHIKELIELDLLDFVALDYKAPRYKFEAITKLSTKLFDTFIQTLDYLISSGVDFEVRTTVHVDLLDEDDINSIIDDLAHRNYTGSYYIQNFFDTDRNMTNIKQSTKSLNMDKIDDKNIDIKYRNF